MQAVGEMRPSFSAPAAIVSVCCADAKRIDACMCACICGVPSPFESPELG